MITVVCQKKDMHFRSSESNGGPSPSSKPLTLAGLIFSATLKTQDRSLLKPRQRNCAIHLWNRSRRSLKLARNVSHDAENGGLSSRIARRTVCSESQTYHVKRRSARNPAAQFQQSHCFNWRRSIVCAISFSPGIFSSLPTARRPTGKN